MREAPHTRIGANIAAYGAAPVAAAFTRRKAISLRLLRRLF
ncbi:hypothetical protein [Bradyrhizobium sp.]|nr:hypothetical protein [Bradyrhizobium sp.]